MPAPKIVKFEVTLWLEGKRPEQPLSMEFLAQRFEETLETLRNGGFYLDKRPVIAEGVKPLEEQA